MTFTRTYQYAFIALALFVLVANDAVLAESEKAASSRSTPSLAGDQLKFNEGVAAYDSGDHATAYEHWLPLAKAGDLAAMRNVAHMLRRGKGVEQDAERALWFYERAARAGLASAALNAGMMRVEPDAPYNDPRKGAEWFSLAAAGGSPEAMWELALLIEKSEDAVDADEAAQALIARAAALGHLGAQERLRRTPPAPAKPQPVPDWRSPPSSQQLPKPSKAESPVTLVTPEQGTRFMKGVFLFDEGDFLAAAKIWRPLADEGVVEAQYRLGRLYRFGLGVTPDVEEARKWLSAAANQGHEKAAETLSILPTP